MTMFVHSKNELTSAVVTINMKVKMSGCWWPPHCDCHWSFMHPHQWFSCVAIQPGPPASGLYPPSKGRLARGKVAKQSRECCMWDDCWLQVLSVWQINTYLYLIQTTKTKTYAT